MQVCVVPIPGQWEQTVNAFHLQNAGLADWCDTWDYDAALRAPALTHNHGLRKWLDATPDAIVDRILDEQPATIVEPIAYPPHRIAA